MGKECKNCKNFEEIDFEEKETELQKLKRKISKAGGFDFVIHNGNLCLEGRTANMRMLKKTIKVVEEHETAHIVTDYCDEHGVSIHGVCGKS